MCLVHSRWQTVISIIVSRVVISPVNQCHCAGSNGSKFNISRQMVVYLSSFYSPWTCLSKMIKTSAGKILLQRDFFSARVIDVRKKRNNWTERFLSTLSVVIVVCAVIFFLSSFFYQTKTGTFDFLSVHCNGHRLIFSLCFFKAQMSRKKFFDSSIWRNDSSAIVNFNKVRSSSFVAVSNRKRNCLIMLSRSNRHFSQLTGAYRWCKLCVSCFLLDFKDTILFCYSFECSLICRQQVYREMRFANFSPFLFLYSVACDVQ